MARCGRQKQEQTAEHEEVLHGAAAVLRVAGDKVGDASEELLRWGGVPRVVQGDEAVHRLGLGRPVDGVKGAGKLRAATADLDDPSLRHLVLGLISNVTT